MRRAAHAAALSLLLAACQNIDVALKVGGSSMAPPPVPAGTVTADDRLFWKGGTPLFLVGYYDHVTFSGLEAVNGEQTSYGAILDRAAGAINWLPMTVDRTSWRSGVLPWRLEGGKVDLDTWDPRYWDALRADVANARGKGVLVVLAMFDGRHVSGGPDCCYRWPNSPWARASQVRDFFGDVDVDQDRNADEPGDFYRTDDFVNDTGIGRHQRRLIAKTLAEIGWAENVLFAVGHRLDHAPPAWTQAVVGYIQALRAGPVLIDGHTAAPGVGPHVYSCCGDVSTYHTRVPTQVGRGHPLIVDPTVGWSADPEPDPMRQAAWYTLTAGAAGWGGFHHRSYATGSEVQTATTLGYMKNLVAFLPHVQPHLRGMVRRDDLVSNPKQNGLLAAEGKAYLAYVLSDATVTIDLTTATTPLIARVYDPRTGTFAPEPPITAGALLKLDRPVGWSDWAVLITPP